MRRRDHLSTAVGTARLWLRSVALPHQRERAVAKLLVIGYAAIGDLIFFLPVLEALRLKYPKARVTFLANRYPTTTELLPATGLVDDIWFHDWEGPRAASEQGGINARIAEAGFDLAVLTLSAPAHYFQHGLASIPLRAGHVRVFAPAPAWRRLKRGLITGEFARRALLNRRAPLGLEPEHALARNLRLLGALGLQAPFEPRPSVPLSPQHRARAEAELPGGPWIGVHLARLQGQYHKIWEPERFAEVCKALSGETRARFMLVGAEDEEEGARRAMKAFPGFTSLVGKLTLLETFAAIARCALFISSDTGLAKAAMMQGVPTATVWGPSDPREYGVVWEPRKHLEIRTGLWCSPCSRMGMARETALTYANCGHHDCLMKLDAAFALRQLRGKYAELLKI